MIHIVRGFSVVNEAEVDIFLGFSCFFCDPEDVGNLIYCSSAFSKSSLNMWKFTVHVLLKPGVENSDQGSDPGPLRRVPVLAPRPAGRPPPSLIRITGTHAVCTRSYDPGLPFCSVARIECILLCPLPSEAWRCRVLVLGNRREARAGVCRLVAAQPWGSTPLLSPLPGSDPTLARPLNSLVSSTCEIPSVVLTHTVSPSWKHPGSPSLVCPQPCSGGALLGHSWDPIAPHEVVPKVAPGQPSDFLPEASTGTPSCPPGSPFVFSAQAICQQFPEEVG